MNTMILTASEFPEPPTDFPEMPDPPLFSSAKSAKTSEQPPSGSDELDFEDLAKRFDMLKKKNVK